MSSFDASPKQQAAGRMREMVRRVAVEAFDAREVEVPIPGFTVLTDHALTDPLAGVRAALFLRNVAEGQLYDYARAARAAGRSWDEIGDALDLPEAEYRSRGEEAFVWLVEGREPEPDSPPLYRTPSVYWRCSTCGQQVTDRGPFESHPSDNESGHAEGCTRHTGDVAAWTERTEGED